MEVASVSVRGQHIGPRIAHSALGTLFLICALPSSVWLAVYVGGFDGWLAGVVSWIGFQIIGAIATIVLRIKGPLLGLHVLLGIPSLIAGYFLTIASHPWQ